MILLFKSYTMVLITGKCSGFDRILSKRKKNCTATFLNVYPRNCLSDFFSDPFRIMKKKIVCLLFSIVIATGMVAQSKKNTYKGKSNSISFGIDLPFGEFPQSHSFGIGTDFAWSNHRFGLMNDNPATLVGFIVNGGIDYYFGRDRTISMYQYSYGNFTYIHTYGGAILNPCKRGNINLTAGPALGIEEGIVEFWWGINLSGSYYVNKTIAITPGIVFMKQSIDDPLVAITLRASLAF